MRSTGRKICSTTQPHLIMADRCAEDENENVITPEQQVPDKPVNVPWESCITLGEYWTHHYGDSANYKSPRYIIHLLIDIVAKGGNLALNIAPQPDGELPMEALKILNEVGNWLKLNGEGIYGTRVVYPYDANKVAYTKKADAIYAFKKYEWDYHAPRSVDVVIDHPVKEVVLLRTGEQLPFVQNGNVVTIDTKDMPLYNMMYADCFRIR